MAGFNHKAPGCCRAIVRRTKLPGFLALLHRTRFEHRADHSVIRCAKRQFVLHTIQRSQQWSQILVVVQFEI